MIVVSPHLGVMAYYWISFMVPQYYAWGELSLPWAQIYATVTIVAWALSREPKLPPWNIVTAPVALLFAWTCITTLFANYPDMAREHLIDFAKIILMMFLTAIMFQERNRLHALIWLFVLSCGFHTVWGGFTSAISGGGNTLVGPPSSLFTTENPFARLALITLPLTYFLYKHSKEHLVRYGMMFAFGTTLYAIFATGSRGGFIGLLAMAAYMWLSSRYKFKMALATLTLAVGVLVILPEVRFNRLSTLLAANEQSTAISRFESWRFGYDTAIRHPLVGGGFGAYADNVTDDQNIALDAHSNYFEVLGEHGFVGLILYLFMFGSLLLGANRISRQTKNNPPLRWEHDLANLLQLSLVGYLAGGLTINQAFWEPIYAQVGMLVALHAIVQRRLRRLDAQS